MAKPILIVRKPKSYPQDIGLLMENLSSVLGSDYFVLATQSDVSDFKFEVFYEKDFTEVKYEELKQIIIDSIKQG